MLEGQKIMTADEAARSQAQNVSFIAYHGTKPEYAEIIKNGGFKLMGLRKSGELGIHFGGSPKYAYSHHGAVIKVIITLQNPIYSGDYWEEFDQLEEDGYKKPDLVNQDPSFTNEMRRRLLEKGYDGLVTGYENVVFNPSQENIKVLSYELTGKHQ